MAEHRCCWEQPCNRCNADTLLFRREKFAGFVPSVSACCRSALHARNHATPYVNVNGTPNGERYNVANGCCGQGGAELPLQGGREANEQCGELSRRPGLELQAGGFDRTFPAMGDDAVIRLGYDNAKVRAGARETEAIMQRAAQRVGHNWNETSKNLKDVFEPFSRGSLAKLAAVGVGIYGAKMAVTAFRNEVKYLSEVEYFSPKKHAQMAEAESMISSVASKVSEMAHTSVSNGITSFMDGVTGNEFSDNAQATARIERANKLAERHNQLSEMARGIQEDLLDGEAKLEAVKKREADLQLKIAVLMRPKTGENWGEQTKREQQVFELQKQGVVVKAQILRLEKEITNQKRAQAAEVDAASLAYEAQVIANVSGKRMKLVELVEKQGRLEREIATTTDDEAKKFKLMAELERTNGDIVDEQKRLAEDGDKKGRAQLANRQRFEDEMQAKELRARGRNKQADKLDREMKLGDRAAEIAVKQGLNPEDALAAARREQSAEERAKKRGQLVNGRHRTTGYSKAKYDENPFVDHRSFNEFFHSDKRRMNVPLSPSYKRGFSSDSKTKGADDSTRLLQRIAQGIDLLTR